MQRPTLIAWVFVSMMLVMTQTRLDAATLPPIRITGELGYDFRYEEFGDSGNELTEHAGRLRLDAATYIYQPWIAQVQGGFGAVLRNQDQTDGGASSELLTGDVALRLFPFSPFPFRAFYSRSDNSQDTTLTDLNNVQDRYGIEQRYQHRRWGRFRFQYEHLEQEQDITNRGDLDDRFIDSSDLFQFGFNNTFGRHGFSASTTASFIDRDDTRQDSDRIFTNLRHSFQPFPTLSTENRITYTDEEQSAARLKTNTRAYEYNNATFWRPRTARPLLVNGLVRARVSDNETNNVRNNQTTYTANAGVSYDYSRRWRYSGNASVSGRDSNSGQDTRTFVRGRADYTPEIIKLGQFDYAWFTGAEVSNTTEDELGSLQTAALDVGHSLDRTRLLSGDSSIRFAARQTLGLIEDTDGRSAQNLLHNVSVTLQTRTPSRSRLVRLSASDSRVFGGGGRQGDEESEFQIVSLLGSVDQKLTRQSSLTGNINIQATRQVSASNAPVAGADEFEPNASIDLTYNHLEAFGVPRLRYRSTLRLLSDSYLPQIDDPRGRNAREQLIWENRIEYAIGRLLVRLTGTYTESNSTDRVLVLLQVRRFFGDF